MGPNREEPYPTIKWEDFAPKLTQLRKGTVQWGAARVQELFVHRLNSKFDDLFLNGSRVNSLSSFTDFIKAGPWDDKMRGIVFYAQDGMWEKCNSWSYNLEAEYARMLGIKFTGVRANGTKAKRTHKGKCAHYLFVKCKGTLVNTIRNATKRAWKEALFNRKPKVTKVSEEEGGEGIPLPMETDADDMAKHIPKILHYQSRENAATSGFAAIPGFNGVIAICEGHASLQPATQAVGMSFSSPSIASSASSSTLTNSTFHNDSVGLELLRKLMATPGITLDKVVETINMQKQLVSAAASVVPVVVPIPAEVVIAPEVVIFAPPEVVIAPTAALIASVVIPDSAPDESVFDESVLVGAPDSVTEIVVVPDPEPVVVDKSVHSDKINKVSLSTLGLVAHHYLPSDSSLLERPKIQSCLLQKGRDLTRVPCPLKRLDLVLPGFDHLACDLILLLCIVF